MTKKQDQTAGDKSLAAQAGRDVHVHVGASAEEIAAAVTSGVLGAMELYQSREIAKETARGRAEELGNLIIEKLGSSEDVRKEVLENPDFHYALVHAGHEYVRSGDEHVAEILADLIATRSKVSGRNRLTLSLNDALSKAAILTENEFAVLSFIFLVRETRQLNLSNWEKFVEFHRRVLPPFIASLPEHNTSLRYLVGHGCAVQSIASTNLGDLFKSHYPGFFSRGINDEQILKKVDAEQLEKGALFIRCLNDGEKWQLNALNEEAWQERASENGLTEEQTHWLWQQFQGSLINSTDVIERISQDLPEIKDAERLWNETLLKHITLTTIGVAIGHANAQRVANLDGDLSIWIK